MRTIHCNVISLDLSFIFCYIIESLVKLELNEIGAEVLYIERELTETIESLSAIGNILW